MHSTKSTFIFVLIMTVIVALALAGMYTVLKPIHTKNEALYAKKSILSAVGDHIDQDFATLSDEQVEEIFASQVEQIVINNQGGSFNQEEVASLGVKNGKAESIDMAKEIKKPAEERLLPLFVFNKSNGDKYYIATVHGKGLWDIIWGYVALDKDMNTIKGIAFDHKAETPGLGAEIKDNKTWVAQFIDKQLYDAQGNYKSVSVVKGGARDLKHEVDAISGATITGDGVAKMMASGLKDYEPYLASIKG